MLIRPATLTDRAAISEMVRACYGRLLVGFYAPEVLAAAVPHMSHVPEDLVTCGTYFVAEVDGVIVGAAGWTDGPQGVEVRKVAVHRDCLRQGVATALMDRVHRSAKAAGHRVMRCSASLNAVPFYVVLGYVQTGRINIDVGQAGIVFEAVTMVLRVGPV